MRRRPKFSECAVPFALKPAPAEFADALTPEDVGMSAPEDKLAMFDAQADIIDKKSTRAA